MRPFLERIIKFALFAGVLYLFFVLIWGHFPFLNKNLRYRVGCDGHLFTRNKAAQKKEDVDILFLGSSHCFRGFDTRIFKQAGYDVFNLGSSAQTPLQAELLANRYLDHLQPKLVLFEVYPNTFTSDGVESTTDLLSNIEMGQDIFELVLAQKSIKLYHTYFFAAFRKYFFNDLEHYQESRINGVDTYVEGGYVEKKMTFYQPKKIAPSAWSFKEAQFSAFERLLQKLKSNDIPVLLVQAPTTKNFYNAHTNNDSFNDRMTTYGKYFNFNELMILNDSLHFYDAHHLNQEGVTLFSEEVLKRLDAKNYFIR